MSYNGGMGADGDVKGMLDARCRKDANGCWLLGKRGLTMWNGRQVSAARLSYEAYIGPVPEGFNVRKKCGRRPCVGPRHLFAASGLSGLDKSRLADSVEAMEWLQCRGLDAADVARLIGVGYQTAYGWFNQGHRPRAMARQKLEEKFPDCPLLKLKS